ncbi:hypothetical protein [Burkholderia sp. Ac-20365]|jgi:hypothetical protein|uniref:hypothetical protein n=1 Tax=Burkholderia sp. Ac-20365 TaxID=2703897 RepID=UPI00197CA695|nr:hypothetical protein [Burkholderia sp. Ac-20365]MBN3762141.1 hypothetical protein [Burkholderia sp. Ac-20365]
MKTLAFVVALAGFAALAAPVASYAKVDQNAEYYRAEDRVRITGGDAQEAKRQSNCQSRGDCAPVTGTR